VLAYEVVHDDQQPPCAFNKQEGLPRYATLCDSCTEAWRELGRCKCMRTGMRGMHLMMLPRLLPIRGPSPCAWLQLDILERILRPHGHRPVTHPRAHASASTPMVTLSYPSLHRARKDQAAGARCDAWARSVTERRAVARSKRLWLIKSLASKTIDRGSH
jgi:hypothetical protein